VFNLGGPEIMVILLMALIVLGPAKLPEAARTVGRFTAEVRRMSNGFRSEVKAAFDDAEEAEARAKGAALVATSTEQAPTAEPGAAEPEAPEPVPPIEPIEPTAPPVPADEP
jgi:sec-independent protein translocase protein TatB